MRRNVLVALAVALFFTSSLAGVALAEDEIQYVRGEPNLDAYAPEPTLTPGTTTQLTLQIENDGEIRSGATARRELVTTARAVTVELEDDGPIVVETERRSIGSIEDGGMRDVPITVTVPEDAEPGEYSLDVTLRYAHTFQFAPRSGVVQERSRRVTRSVDVTVDDGPRFEIDTVGSDVQVGDSGTVRAEVTNVGAETARDLTVGLESNTPDVTLGEGSRNTARIDRLESGESEIVDFDAAIGSGVSIRNVSLAGDVQFTDTDGVRHVQEGLSTGFGPAAEQEFSLSVEESTLRVGETGTIEGTIRNDGPADVRDVVLVLDDAQFEPRSPTYSIGPLERGETATFQFRGTVPSEADATPQRIGVSTRYRTPGDHERVDESSMHVPVAERRDAVAISAIDPTFAAGDEGVIELEVTNQREVEIRDVRLRLDVDDPLESEFRSTVIESLAPGETDRVAFDLEVDSDAPPSRYPATVETTYTDPDDETVTPRPATVAVTVTEAEGVEFLPIELIVFGVLSILVAVAFVWLYRK